MHHLDLGPYKNLSLPPAAAFTEQDLQVGTQQALKKLLTQWVKLHKPASVGDEIVVSLQAVCENLFVPELSSANHKFTIGDPALITPFSEICNKKAGDEFCLTIFCPEGFFVERLQGKEVLCQVKVIDVVHHSPLPIPTDEIAHQMDPAATGLNDLLSRIRQTIMDNWLDMIREERDQQIMAAIITHSSYSLDEAAFQQAFENTLKENRIKHMTSGDIRAIMEQNADALAQSSRIQTQNSILESLVLEEVARLENITLDSSEIQFGRSRLLELAGSESVYKQMFPSEEALHKYLLKEKTYQVLRELNNL